MFRFMYPKVFYLLFLIPMLLYLLRRRAGGNRSIAYSSFELLDGFGLEASKWKAGGRKMLRIIALVFIMLALARPQTGRSEYTVDTKGVDIMLVLDISGSMQAQDFKPKNRLHVAKEVVKEFISKRKHDRIGLVIFAGQAMTQCPLTFDYAVLQKLVENVHFGMLEDRTAVGIALATACNRLKNSKAKSRVVVLLTDGQNNAGSVDPLTAARVAGAMGIRVYTVGVGSTGIVPVPVDDPRFGRAAVPMKVELDEKTLKMIAENTNGKYFLATNPDELRKIYGQIDELEKTRIESRNFSSYSDKYEWFALPALAAVLLEVVLAAGMLREIP